MAIKIKAVTQHAVDRFQERSGSKKPKIERLFRLAEQSVPIGAGRRYSSGWIFVVKKNVVRTVYKPRKRHEFEAIHKSFHIPDATTPVQQVA